MANILDKLLYKYMIMKPSPSRRHTSTCKKMVCSGSYHLHIDDKIYMTNISYHTSYFIVDFHLIKITAAAYRVRCATCIQ